jgi:rhamnosyltransferase
MTGARPRFLVLMASYNGAEWIEEQLLSVINQVDVDVDVQVSDDGSTDSTVAILSNFAAHARLRLAIRQPGTGAPAQNFFAMMDECDASQYDYVAFADQDDIWHLDKLARASRALASSVHVGYSCAVLASWANGRSNVLGQSSRTTQGDFLFEGAGQGCTFVMRRDFFLRAQTFLRQLPDLRAQLAYHDWAMYALARTWRESWCFEARPAMTYRQHSANDTGARSSAGGLARRFRLIRSRWYLRQLEAIADLCYIANRNNEVVVRWRAILGSTPGPARRLRTGWFCLSKGRRKMTDTSVLVLAALAGWLEPLS